MNPRIYIDTSVIGGCFDKEFEFESLRFFKMLEQDFFKILISPVLLKEIEFAPKNVKEKLANISRNKIEYLDIYDEALFLRNQYLENGILSEKRIDDATHVALATIYRADAIV